MYASSPKHNLYYNYHKYYVIAGKYHTCIFNYTEFAPDDYDIFLIFDCV